MTLDLREQVIVKQAMDLATHMAADSMDDAHLGLRPGTIGQAIANIRRSAARGGPFVLSVVEAAILEAMLERLPPILTPVLIRRGGGEPLPRGYVEGLCATTMSKVTVAGRQRYLDFDFCDKEMCVLPGARWN